MIKMKPKKQTAGASLIRRTLKISGLKVSSLLPLPLINIKPAMMIIMPIAKRM
jgi:hypothetical protein